MAAILGVTPQAVCFWRDGKRRLPAELCARIEQATGGKVSRRDLRPDDFAQIWPELEAAGPKATDTLPPGVPRDRRDPTRISPYAGTDIDRRAPAGDGA